MENKGIINFKDFFRENPIKLESDFNKEDFKDFFIPEEAPKNEEQLTEELAEEKLQKLDKLMKEVDSLKDEVNGILEEVEEETIQKPVTKKIIKEEVEEIEEEEYEDIHENNDDDDFYPVFLDKSELFTCQVSIDGADINKTEARLVIESDDWTIMFNGDIKKNGQCEINMKKLSILKEGSIGKIRLEIIAEGSLFIPWEEDYKAKLSKKVSVSVNENRNNKKNQQKNITPSVRVNIKR